MPSINTNVMLVLLLFLSGCQSTHSLVASTETTSEQAARIAKQSIIIDGHIDVPYRLENHWVDVTESADDGDFDYPRAIQGGLDAPFMSIYIPARLGESEESTAVAHRLIDSVEALVGRAPNKFALAYSPDDVEQNFAQGLISLPLGLENGSPIRGDLSLLEQLHQRGIRYITLAHSRSNHISDSSYDDNRQWGGLSPFGVELIARMNQLGIMIDTSHLSDEAFYQVIQYSNAPVIASHSSLREFTPGFERNMDNAMLKSLAQNGGIIMINFGSGFLTREARAWSDYRDEQRRTLTQRFGSDSDELATFNQLYRIQNPYPYANLDTVIDHIDRAVELVGINHVGLGSDYDGVGDTLPDGLKDVASYPILIEGLLKRGYSESDIKKILGENFLRVWREVEKKAQ